MVELIPASAVEGTERGEYRIPGDALLQLTADFPVLAEEPRIEYGVTSKWGVGSRGSNVVLAEQDAERLRTSIEQGTESGDLEYHGIVVRRESILFMTAWQPVETGERA